ncbi:protein phosphatase CheZ [Thiomonas sp. FB-6]|uniref:protein phosphatase CheZ n=1 Tax=Thiomonas sp. FB-6 TaxID=1158291 RepID=UPI000381CD97|nr:protein phosphatase CheZ [Thiomonas sp. FB-6]
MSSPPDAQASGQALHNLREADALLTQGVQRILHASSDLPGASHPLQEVLHLSEQQAMLTLEAVEAAQAELQAIRDTNGGFIDQRLQRLEGHLQTILTTQQGQDLTGQRLKKTISLLQAVESRIQDALGKLGPVAAGEQPALVELHAVLPAEALSDTFGAGRLDQDNVDDLLSQLGL